MRGYWLNDRQAGTHVNQNDGLPHYTDRWKTPLHKSFSGESVYADPASNPPQWNQRDQLVTPDGKVLFDERAHSPVDFGRFRQAIVGQETGGRYGVPNAQGSGAMGLGQQMPATAQALAARIGLPYRPDLLGGTDDASRQYQDAITNAAVREAWNAGGQGRDLRTAAMYYHGGSDRHSWGPKTNRYADEVLARVGAH